MINMKNQTPEYEYFLRYHPGNTRVVLNTDAQLVEQHDYYPFGMEFAGRQGGDIKYRYNGKELQDMKMGGRGLDWYDYGARFYDPAIGRWFVPDPLSPFSMNISPYCYVEDNPIYFIDPNGLIIWPWDSRKKRREKEEAKQARKTRREATKNMYKPKGGKKYNPNFTHYYGWQVDPIFTIDDPAVDIPDLSLPDRGPENYSWLDRFEQPHKDPSQFTINWNGKQVFSGVLQFNQDVFVENSSEIRKDDPTIDANFSSLVKFAGSNPDFIIQIVISTPYMRGQTGENIINPSIIASRPEGLKKHLRKLFGTLPANLGVNIQYSTQQIRLHKGTSAIITH